MHYRPVYTSDWAPGLSTGPLDPKRPVWVAPQALCLAILSLRSLPLEGPPHRATQSPLTSSVVSPESFSFRETFTPTTGHAVALPSPPVKSQAYPSHSLTATISIGC